MKKKKLLKEGRVIACVYYKDNSYLTIIAGLRCETDFLSRSIIFTDALIKICDIKKKGRNIDTIVENLSKESKEKIEFEDSFCIESNKNFPSSYYIHHDNKKVAIVEFEVNSDNKYHKEIKELAYNIAMHVVAFSPLYLNKKDVDWENIDLKISEDLLKNKPENIIEKIKLGKKIKYNKEYVLLEQPFVKDLTKTVSGVIKEFNKKYNTGAKIINYQYIIL